MSRRHLGVDDPQLLAQVEDRVLAAAATRTPDELARVARDALKRLDPAGSQRRAKAAPPLQTALGLDDLPGEVPGLGIIPATSSPT